MKRRSHPLLVLLARLALGGVFLYAGVLKITDPVGFAGSIAAYRILPYFGNYLVAAILPWLEVICGVLMIVGYRIRPATTIIALLNVVFIIALLLAMVRGLEIDCGCFRQTDHKTPLWLALLRDILFLAGAMFILRETKRSQRLI